MWMLDTLQGHLSEFVIAKFQYSCEDQNVILNRKCLLEQLNKKKNILGFDYGQTDAVFLDWYEYL